MSNPDQLRNLATISSLAISMQKQTLSDIQMDLLEVAAHLMTNIAVQSTLHGQQALNPAESPAHIEFQPGEPVFQLVPAGPLTNEYEQRTTIIDKEKVSDDPSDPEYRYKTAHSGRSTWLTEKVLRKVVK